MTTDVSRDVLAAEQRRCAAMLASDLATLDTLLDPRLSFAHATGQVDDKSAYMAKIAAGRIDYVSIDWSEEHVIPLSANAALLAGRMTSSVTVEGVVKQLENRVLAAWSLTDGAWRIVAFQSTPLRG